MNRKYISVALVTIAGIATIVPVFAQTNTSENRPQGRMYTNSGAWAEGNKNDAARRMMVKPAAVGTVTSISGNIITISGGPGMPNPGAYATKTTFTVNATNATILKNNATSSVSAIAVGDNLFIEGTLTGTTVTATVIHDGNGPRSVGPRRGMMGAPFQLEGNGQPVIAGNVSAISGNTLTVTNKSNVTYTVDVTNAKVTARGATSTPSSIVVGDMVVVQGTVNGTSISASMVVDSGMQAKTLTTQIGHPNQGFRNLFGGLGNFFSRLFGF